MSTSPEGTLDQQCRALLRLLALAHRELDKRGVPRPQRPAS